MPDPAPPAPPGAATRLLVVQGTPFCNIDCRYCYLPNRTDKSRMELATFRRVLERVIDENLFDGPFTVVWHAGEPLVLPVAFYRACIGITRALGARHPVSHSLQTNGVLITPEWCRFFKEAGIVLGVSIDGPQFLHDRKRVDRRGRGTFDQVLRGVSLLREHAVPFGVICVLTADHLDHAPALFEFFRGIGAQSVGFNIDEVEGVNTASSFRAEDFAVRFRDFVIEVLTLNEAHGNCLSFPNLTVDLLNRRPPIANHQVVPWQVATVDFRGNVSTFSPELLGSEAARFGNFVLGNLLTDRFDEIARREPYLELSAEIARGVERCRRECDYFDWCGGGAPANKYFEHGSFDATETLYCRLTRKAVCDANLALIERDLANAAKQ